MKRDELDSCGGESLGLEQEVVEIAIASTPTQQRFDVPVDYFDDAQRHLVRQ